MYEWMNEWMNKRSKKDIKLEIWELGWTETKNVVYNCVKCTMKID